MSDAAPADVPAHQLRPLPAGWISVLDEASGEFYYVDETKTPPEITWDDPRLKDVAGDAPAAEPPKDAEAPAPAAPAKPAGNPFVSMQTSGAPVPVLPVGEGTKPSEVKAAEAAKAAAAAEPPKAAEVVPPPKEEVVPPPKDEPELQENGLPKGWLAVLDPPSGRFFFVDENKDPAVVTWDDPRTPEIEEAPEEKPKKVYAPPPPKPAAAPPPVAAPPTTTFAPPPKPAPAPQQFAPPPVAAAAPAYAPPPVAAAAPAYAAPPVTTYAAPQATTFAAPTYAAPAPAPQPQVVYVQYAAPATPPPPVQQTYVPPPQQQYYTQPPPPQKTGPSVGQILVGGAVLGMAVRNPGAALMVGAMTRPGRRY